MIRKRSTRKEKFVRWDPVESLKSDEDVAAYLNAALDEGDAALLAAVLGDIAKARGMLKIAEETGMTRQGLYKALGPNGNPSVETMLKVARALGFRVKFEPRVA